MKKILSTISVLLLALVLVACKNTENGDDNGDGTNVANTYRTYTSGTANINPYSESLATASDLYGLLTDSLYTGDFDWETAIEEGLAEHVGDFTNNEQLPYTRIPSMAAGEPVDVNGDGTVWEFTLRDDLEFEDGTPINAETFNYSWRQLLDPLQLNVRSSNLYDSSNLPLVNAREYVFQHSQKADEFGEPVWDAGDKGIVETRNALAFTNGDWEYFHASEEGYILFYMERPDLSGNDWLLAAWDPEASDDEKFVAYVTLDAEGNYSLLPDGTPNPEFDGTAVGYVQEPTPLLMYEDGTKVTLDDEGEPVGVTAIPNEPVDWEDVGFEVTGELSFKITLTEGKDDWYVKGQLMSGITGVVHEAKYEAGMNATRTQTTYGTIDNPLVSYGPYNLTEWQDGVLYLYERNDDHHAADDYRIKYVRYEVIADQSIAVNEFKAGRLDLVGASGEYFKEFEDSPHLKLTPATTFFRFAFNIAERPDGTTNPILSRSDFRQAFYYAIDRDEFATEVRAPAHPTQGFLGPVYVATEYGSVGYRASQPGIDVLEDRSSETHGFNPGEAKRLFDLAYADAVSSGDISDGDVVSVEYTYYDVETNVLVAEWVKTTVETIFNDGESTPKFELELNGVSSDALDAAWDNFDFDMTFGGWQGLNFNPISLMGQVYNSISGEHNMLEHGFNTGGASMTVDLPNTKAALERWVDEFDSEGATEAQLAAHDRRVAILERFGQDGAPATSLTGTFDNFYTWAGREFYNVNEVNYEGKNDDFNAITAGIENILLDQMIGIPLFTTVSATVYSSRVVFETNAYHAWMGWGGLKYMYLDSAN